MGTILFYYIKNQTILLQHYRRVLNPSATARERGERKPSGAALKLLNLVEAKGLDAVI